MHDEQNIDPCNEPTPEAGVVPEQEQDTDVLSLIEDVERHLSRIRNVQSKQVQEFTDLASRQQAMEQAEEALAGDAKKIKADQNALDQERASIEHFRVESQKSSSLVEEAEKKLNLRSKEVNSELDSLHEGRVALSQGEEDLEARSKELSHEAEQLSERMAELETQREEMLAQHAEMENLLATNVNRLEQAESELEECLERAESAETQCQSLDERCSFLAEDAKKVRSQLRMAGERLSELADVVSTQAPQLEEGAAAMASLQEQARTIATLEKKLAQAPSLEEDSGKLQEECAQAKKRADELEEALVIAQDRGQAQEFAKKLRSKGESLSKFAKHLDLRKLRLEILRKGVRENARSGEDPTTFRDLQRLKSQKDDLEQARLCLVESEKAMLSKWARPRALAASVWLSFLIFCVGGGSWLVVENMLSAPGTATVDLVASTRSGRPLENLALTDWMKWHEALPTDPAFVHVVASRLSARGIAPAGGEEAVAHLLANDLAFDSDGPGKLRLVLWGDDRRTIPSQLDVIATSMASESARQAPRREQSARAMIVGESKSTGRIQYASLVPSSLDSAFLTRYGIVSGVALAVALLIATVAYVILRRAKRIFEESEMGFEADSALG